LWRAVQHREKGSAVTQRPKYVKRTNTLVVAVQLDLDTEGFRYQKWGGEQTCKPGDWIVNNGGDVYTVDRETFQRTYREESSGLYRKITPVWVELAEHDGAIPTKEGVTHYKAGDYLVFNDEDGKDGYAVSAASFTAMYVPAE
jgi:hypothetical protein